MSAPCLFEDDYDLPIPGGPVTHHPMVTSSPAAPDPASETDVTKALRALQPYLSRSQWLALSAAMRGEEGQFFGDKAMELANIVETMPATYGQDGKGEDETIVYLHYFLGDCHWFITEKDVEDGVSQAFGFAVLHGDLVCAELGYISIAELVETGVGAEMDFYFTPKPLSRIREEMEVRYGP